MELPQLIQADSPCQLSSLPRSPEGFQKVRRTEEVEPSPFPDLPPGVLEMRVKEGSKIRNLMGFAVTRMLAGLRQVVFTGSGQAVTKTITCAEILKRRMGGLHQVTKLQYRSVREVWERQQGGGAVRTTVHRNLPAISILLSRDPLDSGQPGYQPPESIPHTPPRIPDKRPHNDLTHSSNKRVCVEAGTPLA